METLYYPNMSLAQVPEPDQDWVPEDNFASRLVLLRRAKNLAQEEAAAICGIKASTWATWELGRSPRNMAEVANKIHDGLRVSREWLMWGVNARSRCFCANPQVPEGSHTCSGCGGRDLRAVPEQAGMVELPLGWQPPTLTVVT